MKVNTDVGIIEMPDGCYGEINYKDGTWCEKDLTSRIISVLDSHSPDDTVFVDIGSNIGYYTILALKKGYNVISVEASPRNYDLMLKNVLANCSSLEVSRLSSFNSMVWDKGGYLNFYESSNNCGDNRSFLTTDDDFSSSLQHKFLTVKAHEVVNPVVKKLGIADSFNIVCKIDTQGSDHAVLNSFSSYIDNISDCFVEYWPFGISRIDHEINSSHGVLDFYVKDLGLECECVEDPDRDVYLISDNSYVNLHLRR